jgi:hypothetical protein
MRQAAALVLMFCITYTTALQGAELSSPASPPAHENAQDYSQNNSQDYDNGQDYGYENYSADQLDNLLAPIALYPDPLLAQVLPAATFVDQIDEAARYLRAYGQNGVDNQDWDVSVKAVAHYPAVLDMMADKIDWTTALGQAYVNQSTDVMSSVQRLRRMASDQGNLASNTQQQVIVQPSYIQIWPAQPQYVYVPVYNPAYVYYRRPSPGLFFITFGTGLFIGAWLNRDCDWGGRRIYYTGWNGGGWVGRSRGYVHIQNTVYVNNRYTNVTINRTVVNRRVNYTSINRYNSVHRNVNYNNLTKNNTIRDRRPVNTTRPANPGDSNRPGNPGTRPPNNNNRPPNNNTRPGNTGPSNKLPPTQPTNKLPTTQPVTRPTNKLPNNGVIDRNISTGDTNLNNYRGRDNPQARPATQPARPVNQPNPAAKPAPSTRPAPQNNARPAPQAFTPRESNDSANRASARGQASRAQEKQPPARQPSPQRQPAQKQPAPPKQQNSNAPKNSGKPR